MAGVSGGRSETATLRQNLEDQLDRLVTQLEELEEAKGDMDPSEWQGIRDETQEELQHFSNSLEKMLAGDTTLVDQLSSLRLATQAAISDAFKTPEVSHRGVRIVSHTCLTRLSECSPRSSRDS